MLAPSQQYPWRWRRTVLVPSQRFPRFVEIPSHCWEPSKIILRSSSVAVLNTGACTVAPLSPADMSGCRSLTGDDYVDMVFYCGEIFTITHSGELSSHDLILHRHEHVMKMTPSLGSVNYNTVCGLVVSADKKRLLMVRWRRGDDESAGVRGGLGRGTMVGDLEVKDLGGHVMFISRSCCRTMVGGEGPGKHWCVFS